MQLNEVLGHNTVWSIYKFRDPTGEIAKQLKAGASIEDVLREHRHSLKEIDIEKGNILLNEGITEIWDLVIGSYRAVTGEVIGTGDGLATTFSDSKEEQQ